ncbi:hypothetical protein DICPUDRAFT_83390 [Dictyostelium purpureum]|uniref:Cytochrome P450 family protein n=1 Tax=Dictyostelium purpureum TaxID=5786 RepID=F0ZZE1_DICPU|nr:uncharacterized protein DICPUDRAFT_83390 [Dictyostelium purpureum]EGC30691.1 hypothetical protein DICPUDRAFT_83390 [Dictyostelium purpureum]|eukprot:XP_003292789.1 hypothetical protein DICPUDRAFT_83390 [Dictyostelium purpureum]
MNILITFLYIFLFYIFYSWYEKIKFIHKKELKGPFPLPIIGNAYLSDHPYYDFFKFSKKYGDIFRIWVGDLYTVVLSDESLIREVFHKNSDNFNDRPKFPTMKYLSNYHGLVTSSGEYWKINREIVSQSLTKIHSKHLYESLEYNIEQVLNKFEGFEKRNESFNPKLDCYKFTTSLMFKYIFNEEITNYDDPIIESEIIKPTNRVFEKLSNCRTGDALKILRPFYEFQLKYFEQSGYKIFDYLNKKLEQHVETFDENGVPRDLLDILFKEYGNDKLSILSTAKDLLLGGIDTSATIFYNIIMLSCNYKEIQDKVYEELKSVSKEKKRIYLSDRNSLPYTNAFIKECLRYRPVAAFPLPHTAKNDITISNGRYFIPKDSQVLINFYALYRNEKYFPNPETFDPSRFINCELANQAFMPFSMGPRICVARQFALDEIFLFISNLLLNFKVSSNKTIDHSINDYKYGLTIKLKKEFNINLKKR